MKTIDKKSLTVRAVTCVLLLFSCLYMYDFYKCLSGFIANGFREPLVMLPMILAFLLPVLCFWVFFYDFYVRALHPVVKAIYSVLVALCAMTDLVLIFVNIDLYASNNALGVYDALPGVVLHFPYDMIIVLTALALLQIFNLVAGNRKGSRAGAFLEGIKQRGTFRIRVIEYLALCVLAMMVFIFTGAAICATFTAWENALYDFRYVFLLIWVMLVPMANLIMLALKPEKAARQKSSKLTVLSAWIGTNLLFGLLFLLLELTCPDFIVHLGKPLFPIAFLVSLPIEPGIILGIMALGTLVAAIRMIMVAAKRNERV
jgi:hypothetical protein